MSKDLGEFEKLLLTHQPTFCKKCGGRMQYRASGTYVCEHCKQEELDDFGKIKYFLSENGPAPIYAISNATGVDREVIDLYLKKGRIEIPEGSKFYLKCEKCGCAIRYGRFCPDCAKDLGGGIASLLSEEVGEKPKSLQGKMHYVKKH